MSKYLISCAILLLIAGCTTAYQKSGATGGFTETQVAPNMWRVTFSGNGYTSDSRAEDLALLRSADLTIQNGYRYFVLLQSGSKSSYSTVPAGAQGSYLIASPSSSNNVLMLNEKDSKVFTYDAEFVCKSLGAKYEASCGQIKN